MQRQEKLLSPTIAILIVVITLIVVLAVTWLVYYSRARDKSRLQTCMSNLQLIGKALSQYTADYNETLPLFEEGDEWQWSKDYLRSPRYLACPALAQPHGYAVNPTVSGTKTKEVIDKAIFWDGEQISRAAYWTAYLKRDQNQSVPGLDFRRHSTFGANIWLFKDKGQIMTSNLPAELNLENPIFTPVLIGSGDKEVSE